MAERRSLVEGVKPPLPVDRKMEERFVFQSRGSRGRDRGSISH